MLYLAQRKSSDDFFAISDDEEALLFVYIRSWNLSDIGFVM